MAVCVKYFLRFGIKAEPLLSKITAMDNLDLLNNDLQVTPPVYNYLNETARWGKFLAILGFIGCGLMLLLSFFVSTIMMSIPPYNQMTGGLASSMPVVITIIYIALALLFFIPCLYLYRYSVKMKSALSTQSQEEWEASLSNLKSLFKFYGIMCIVILSLYALIFILAMVAGAMSGS